MKRLRHVSRAPYLAAALCISSTVNADVYDTQYLVSRLIPLGEGPRSSTKVEIWLYSSLKSAQRLLASRVDRIDDEAMEYECLPALALSPDRSRFARVQPIYTGVKYSRKYDLLVYSLEGKRLAKYRLDVRPRFKFGWIDNRHLGVISGDGIGHPLLWTTMHRKFEKVDDKDLPSRYRVYENEQRQHVPSAVPMWEAVNPEWTGDFEPSYSDCAYDPSFKWTLYIHREPRLGPNGFFWMRAFCKGAATTYAWRRDLFTDDAVVKTMAYPRVCGITRPKGSKRSVLMRLDLETGLSKVICDADNAVVVHDLVVKE